MDEGQDLILRKDGISYEDVETILSKLYQQNQKMEKEMIEFRLVAMKQREVSAKTDEHVARLESIINKQDREMEIMKQEIRELKTNVKGKRTILKHVLRESRKCSTELESAKQSIEHIEKVVNIELAHVYFENDQSKAINQDSKKMQFSQIKKKNESSSRKINQVLDKITSMRTGINVSTGELHGDDNLTILRKGIKTVSMSGLHEGFKHTRKQFRSGNGILFKRDTAVEGIAFSAYLDHNIQHMGRGHHIICNQVLLNDGNHYNIFTGIFTVPQTGVYLLTYNIGAEHNNHWTQVRLMVNNRPIADAIVQVTGTQQKVSAGSTALIKLNQGESVWLENSQRDSEVMSGSYYRWTTFSGLLLY